jgi:hypothetical protein
MAGTSNSMGCNTMQFEENLTFWRNMLPLSSGLKSKTSKKPVEVGRKLSKPHVENPTQKPMEERPQSGTGLRDSQGDHRKWYLSWDLKRAGCPLGEARRGEESYECPGESPWSMKEYAIVKTTMEY